MYQKIRSRWTPDVNDVFAIVQLTAVCREVSQTQRCGHTQAFERKSPKLSKLFLTFWAESGNNVHAYACHRQKKIAELFEMTNVLRCGHISYIQLCSGQEHARETFACQQDADTLKVNNRQHNMERYGRMRPTHHPQVAIDGGQSVRPLHPLSLK